MSDIRRALGVALILSGVGLAPGAQQAVSADSDLQERARVDYVLLDVLAFDREGEVVTDLTVDDPSADEQPPRLDSMSPLRSARSFADPFRRVIDACLRNRATFHTFDMYNFNPGGERKSDARLRHRSDRVTGAHKTFKAELNEGLIELAKQSGGFYHSGATLRPMRSVVDRSRFVYTLGYSSPGGKPEKFRKIKVKCKRRGVDLRYRSGYFAGAAVPVRGL